MCSKLSAIVNIYLNHAHAPDFSRFRLHIRTLFQPGSKAVRYVAQGRTIGYAMKRG
jgi:hypothetical protein